MLLSCNIKKHKDSTHEWFAEMQIFTLPIGLGLQLSKTFIKFRMDANRMLAVSLLAGCHSNMSIELIVALCLCIESSCIDTEYITFPKEEESVCNMHMYKTFDSNNQLIFLFFGSSF